MTERPRYDLHGWRDIAAFLGRTVRTAQRWARRPVNPLPIAHLMGRAEAASAELNRWVERETAREILRGVT